VYPSEVRHRIRRDSLADYLEVARKLNRSSVGVVSVQHEYGIWVATTASSSWTSLAP